MQPASKVPASTAPVETDTVIVGAGPCGLFQVFELGLLGIKADIVDSLQHPGGQCTELYPDKPIYDIPALPVCGAQELVDRLMQQIKPFQPRFHLGQEVTELTRRDDARFFVRTALDTHVPRPHRGDRRRSRIVPAEEAGRWRARTRSRAGSCITGCATPRAFTASGW